MKPTCTKGYSKNGQLNPSALLNKITSLLEPRVMSTSEQAEFATRISYSDSPVIPLNIKLVPHMPVSESVPIKIKLSTEVDRKVSLKAKIAVSTIFCGIFIALAGTVFDSIGIVFGFEQACLAVGAGGVGCLRLFAGT